MTTLDAKALGQELARRAQAGDPLACAIVEAMTPTIREICEAGNRLVELLRRERSMTYKKLRRYQCQQARQRAAHAALGVDYEA